MMRVKKGDEVVVLLGKDRGRRGAVLSVLPRSGKVIVESINMIKRHTKGNPTKGVAGGIIEKEAAIDISNVALWNPISQKADRVGFRELEDGTKVRYFKSNNEIIDG